MVSGCGNQYRPVVSAINPVGPAGQPTKYAIAVSNTTPYGSSPTDGLLTFVDFSGDTILATPSILPFPAPTTAGTTTTPPTPTYVNPLNFDLTQNGSQGFIVNDTGQFEDFYTSNPASLLTTSIIYPETLAPGVIPAGVQSFSLPSTGQTLFVPEPNVSSISELAVGSGASLLQNLSVANPVYVVGADSALRVYAIDQGNGTTAGQVYPIDNSPVSLLTPIPVGTDPVYGVMTTDDNRAFILNKGSGTVSVINVPSNALDAGIPANSSTGTPVGTFSLPNTASGAAPNPVWADLLPQNSEMVVLNQGDGVTPGSLSIVSIPLCNTNSPVINPNCNATNPSDAVGFGSIVGNVSVGTDPTMVSVLYDATTPRAYVVNQTDTKCPSSLGNGTYEGSVSVVNLVTMQLSSTICGISTPAGMSPTLASSDGLVFGHPNTISATSGSPTGKVYVTSSDSKYMTVIETDTDTVETHTNLQGLGVRVLVTSK
jgi:hypothetical protein